MLEFQNYIRKSKNNIESKKKKSLRNFSKFRREMFDNRTNRWRCLNFDFFFLQSKALEKFDALEIMIQV